jgi:dUTPase
MPVWWCCKIYARSSLPCKTGLMLWNSVALIDSDYRWEYFMQIYNYTNKAISIEKYTRLCQLEFAPHHWWKNNFWSEMVRGTYKNNHQLLVAKMAAALRIF